MQSKFFKRAEMLLTIAVLLLTALTACGNENDPHTVSSAVPTAASETAVSSEASADHSIVGQWKAELIEESIYTFYANGTGQYFLKGTVIPLTYSIRNNRITIHYQKQSEETTETSVTTQDYEYELNGKILNIKDPFGMDNFYDKID